MLSDAVSSTGSALVESGGTLEIGGNDAQLVVFSGTNDVLRLDDPMHFFGRLCMISVGDTIHLTNTTVTAAPSISNGTLTVDTSAGTLTYAITREITGTTFSVTPDGAGGSDLVLTVPGQVFTLTTGVDSFLGGLGNDIFNASSGTINTGDSIDGGGGTNTLSLNGSGTFNLSTATAFNHIQIVDATDSGQTITLRSGTAFTVQVGTGTVADRR